MKLLRYGPAGFEKPGLVDDRGRIRDLSSIVDRIEYDTLSPAGLARLRAVDAASLPVVRGKPRLGVPFTGIGKFLAVGLNYSDHAAESGMPVPTEPILFTKATTCLWRSGRRHDRAARLDPARLGGRARDRHRHEGAVRRRGAGARSRGRLLRRQRRVGAPVPARTRQPVGQGQGLRHVRAGGAVARHRRRGARPAGARPLGSTSTAKSGSAATRRRWSSAARRWSRT